MRQLFEEQKENKDKSLRNIYSKLDELQKRIEQIEKQQVKEKKQSEQQDEQNRNRVVPDEIEQQEQASTEVEEPYIILQGPEEQNQRKESIKALQQDTMKEVVKNRKQIIQQKIIAHASASRKTAKQLKEIFVDTYKYCSKATFYRYLQELAQKEHIQYISINTTTYIIPLTTITEENFSEQ